MLITLLLVVQIIATALCIACALVAPGPITVLLAIYSIAHTSGTISSVYSFYNN